jgi:hypothetical protein
MSGVVAVVGEVVVVAVLPVIAGKEIEAWRRLKGIRRRRACAAPAKVPVNLEVSCWGAS